MTRRLVVAVLAAAVLVVATAPGAVAQSKSRQDRAGDGPRVGDVRSIRVQNNARKMAVTVRLTRVVPGRSAVAIGLTPDEKDADAPLALVDVLPVSDRRFRVRALVLDPTQGEHGRVDPLRCAERHLTIRPGRRGLVRVVIAQSCLGDLAGRLQTQASAYDKRRAGAITDGLLRTGSLRRGDADATDEPFSDESPTVTTRRG